MAPTVLGKYEIRGVLGKGSAGIVYDAWDPVIARRVAIKTVELPSWDGADTQAELDRFRREAQAAGRLSHPNIVPIFDYGETDAMAYIVMEYVGGGSLQTLMGGHRQVPLPEIARVMDQLLSALQFSHDRGVVHRDIKPANVLLSDDQTLKIADFGVARIEGSAATMVGALLGTPAYMSPEQWRGDPDIDLRSDIYAAGVMLYHMLTGRRPFDGNQSAIMQKVLNGAFDPPSAMRPTVPPALEGVVLKAMAKEPGERFESAAAFAGALKHAVTAAPEMDDAAAAAFVVAPARVSPGATGSFGRAMDARRRGGKRAAIGAGVALLLLGGGGAGWFLLQSPTAPRLASVVAPNPPPATDGPSPGASAASAPPVAVPPSAPSPVAAPPSAPSPVAAPPSAPSPVAAPEAGASSSAPSPVALPPPVAVPPLREAAAAPCAAVYGEVSEARLALRGIVPADGYDMLRASFDQTAARSRAWDVHPVPMTDFYCQVIDALRPVLRGIGDQAGVSARLLPSPVTHSIVLKENDPIDFEVTGPNMPSLIQVDYVDSAGKVSHYMPRKAAPAFAPRRLRADERIRLFDTVPGAAFQVAPPPGTDLVVVIASSEALQMSRAKDDDDDVVAYIRALRTALETGRRKGVRVSVDLVPVESSVATPKE